MTRHVSPETTTKYLLLMLVLYSISLPNASGQFSGAALNPASIQPTVRIQGSIRNDLVVSLPASVHPLATSQNETGATDPGYVMDRMVLTLQSDAAQVAAIEELMKEQQDPRSANYHKWLAPADFGRHFGASQADIASITAWLQSHGFKVDEVPVSRRSIIFSGTARQVEAAFHTQIRSYSVNGEVHHANATAVEIPQALAAVVAGVVSLHDFRGGTWNTARTGGPGTLGRSNRGNHLGPADFARIYNLSPLYQSGIMGDGQSIAIAGRTDISLSDVAAFRAYFGLPVKAPQVILNGADPGVLGAPGELDEALLNVEWAGAVAPNAAVKFVVSKSTAVMDGSYASAAYIVNHNVAPIMSMSFAVCENALGAAGNRYVSDLWQQAAAQGITVLVAAGDSGAAACDSSSASTSTFGQAVNGLASTPYNTSVGGTQFDDANGGYWNSTRNSASKLAVLSYIPEVVWNESGSSLSAGGGGPSAVYAKPYWQVGAGVPADGRRDMPDLALAAALHDGYTIFKNGAASYVGGTSAASSAFAGLMALVVEKAGQSQGNINPVLYQLAGVPPVGNPIFHEIISGSNAVPGVSGFPAGPGYNQAAGLGSVDGASLAEGWTSAANGSSFGIECDCPAGITVARGANSSPVNLRITAGPGFNSVVALSISGLPSAATATLSNPSVNSSPGLSALSIDTASTTAAGSYSITASATAGTVTRTVQIPLLIQGATLSASHPSVRVTRGGKATNTITLVPLAGFNSDVFVSVTGAPPGLTPTFSNSKISGGSGSATLTIAASSKVKPGTYPLTISGTGIHERTTIIAEVAAPFTVTPGAASVALVQGGSGTSTVTIVLPNGSSLADSIALAVTGTVAGLTATWDTTTNGTLDSTIYSTGATLTIAVASTVKVGTYPLTITGTDATSSTSETAAISVVVTAPFTIVPTTTLTVPQGGSGADTVNVTFATGFSSTVAMTANVITGFTATYSAASLSASGPTTLTLAADHTVKPGTYTLSTIGTGNGVALSAPITVTVVAPFAVKSSAASVSMLQTGSGNAIVFIGSAASGFVSNVVLTVTGTVTGLTTAWDSTTNGTLASPYSASAALTISASSAVKTGTYPLTITGTGNGVVETTTINAVVTAPFTVVPTATVTLPQGGSATDTVNVTYATGFSASVALTATLPTGVSGLTASYSPTSVSATGSSTLSLAADHTVKAGSYTVTAIGTGSGVVISAPITVTVVAPFTVKSSAASVALLQAASGTAEFSVVAVSGFVSNVVLTVTSATTGLTGTWDTTSNGTLSTPYSSKATLTIAATAAVKPGTYALTITGTGNGVTATTTVNAVVSAPFTVVPTATVTVPQGGTSTDTVKMTYATGFSSSVAMTATLPTGISGLTATYSPASVSATGNSTLTLAANSTVKTGSYTVTAIGTGNGVAISAPITVTVAAPYAVQSSAASVALIATGSGTANISLSGLNAGFVSDVVLTASGTSLPAGLTTSWDTTSAGTLTKGAGTATLTIAADKTVASGTYTLTITGTGNSVAETTTVKAVVSAPFTVVPTATVTVPQGGTATDTVKMTYATAFSSAVAMTATLPTGVSGLTATYSPTSVSATGNSTLTVAADHTVKAGSYTVTAIGTGSGVAISAPITVTVVAPFTVKSSAASVALLQAASGTADFSVTAVSGFVSNVVLTVTSATTGLTGTWDTTSNGTLSTPYSSKATLTIAATAAVKPGTYALTITGTGNGVTATTTVNAVVSAPFTVVPTATVTVPQGGTSTDTVKMTYATGFSSSVAMTATLPTGISGLTATYSPASVSATGNSILTLAADSTVKAGSYTVTAIGTGNGVAISAPITVTVAAPYAVQSSAASVALIATGTGTANISLSGLNAGFVSDVVLTAAGTSLPAGLTTSWDTTSAGKLTKGAGTATLTIAADKTVASGTYTLTITGTGNSVAETTTVKAVVSAPFTVVPTATVTVPQGGTATDTVKMTYATAFSSAVAMTATLPTGVSGLTATYSPTSVSATGNSTLTVAADHTVKAGSYTVTAIGTGSGVAISAPITVTVVAPFTVKSSAASVALLQAASGTADFSVVAVSGFVSNVALTVTSATTGLTGTWDTTSNGTLSTPYSSKATLTIAATAAVKPGTYALTITGTGNGVTATTTVNAVVSAPFTVVPTATVTVPQGGTSADTVKMTYATGFSSSVAMTATLPTGISGLTATYSPASVSATGNSTLTLAADSTVKTGSYTVTAIGTGNGVAISAPITVTVAAPYAVQSSAASVALIATGTGTANISLSGLNAGFVSDVVLTAAGTGLPAGLTTSWDTTSAGKLTKGAGTATLTIAADKTVASGTYTLTITGTGNSVAETTTVKAVVSAPFTVVPTATVTVPQGGTATDTVKMTYATAFSSAVAMTATLPTGVSGLTATYSPTSVSATGNSTLTVAADHTVKAGSYTVTAIGTGSGVAISAPITVTVVAPFTVKSSAASVALLQAASGTADFSVTAVSGFVSDVVLTVTSATTGLTGTWDTTSNGTLSTPYSSKATLTIAATAAVKPGTYALTITGTGNGVTATTTVNAVVSAPFTVVPTATVTVPQGGTSADTVKMTYATGFSSSVAMTATLPTGISGLTATYSPASVSATGNSTLTLAADSTVKTGSYTVTAIGTGNGVAISAPITVTVAAPYAVQSSAASVALIATGTGTANISLTGLNAGFVSDVVLTAAGTGLPAGLTTSWDTTSAGKLTKGAGTATLTIAADKTVAAGTYTLTITGTGNSVAETTTVKAVVSAPFTVVPTATVTVPQGGTATDTVKMTYATAFSAAVAMTATLPTGVSGLTATYSPTSVSATGNSTLTVAADHTVKAGTYTVTAIGTGSGVAISAPITVTVVAPFTVKSSAASVALLQAASGTADFSVVAVSGFVSNVVLTVTSATTGLTGTWDTTSNGTLSTPYSSKATLTIAATAAVKPGTYALTITGTGNGVTATTTVNAVVSAPFTVVPTATVTVPQGGTSADTVKMTYATGFSSSVAMTATLPTGISGLTATYSPASLSATGNSTLTLAADSTVKTGSYTVTAIGTGNGVAISAPITVTVAAPYAVQSSAASVALIATGTGTANISLSGLNAGFVSDVVLTAAGTGLPAGLTTSWDTTSAGKLTKGAGTATLTIAADKTVAAGTYTLTITGTGNSVAETTTVKAVVSAPFTVVPTATVTVPQGGTATDTVKMTYATAFSAAVAMTATLPTGVSGLTATYSPTSVSATGNSTLTVAADHTVKAGSYTVTAIGTGSGVAISAPITVTVVAPFTVKSSAASVALLQAASGTADFSVVAVSGFVSNVVLTVTSATTGLTGTWDTTSNGTLSTPYSSKATLTIAATAAVKPGTYALTITGTGNGVTATTTVNAVVSAPFTVVPTATVTVPQGGTSADTVKMTYATGFSSSVAMTATLPTGISGLTATYSPASLSATGNSTLTLAADSTVKTGSYTVTAIGTGNGVAISAPITVTVAAPYAVQSSAASVALIATGTGTANISLSGLNAGFVSDVVLTAAGTGLPAGLTTSWDTTSAGKLTKGAGTATLTIAADKTVASGTYTLTITGTGNSVAETTTVKAVVSAPFTVVPTATVTVPQGGTATDTVKMTYATAFSSAVAMTATLPTGVSGLTATYSPTSVSATGNSALTLAADSTVKTGSYTVTAIGTGSGVAISAPITVTVAAPYAVQSSAASVALIATGSGTANISLSGLNAGFVSDVVLTATGTGLPAGLTTSWDTTSAGKLTKGAGTATLTIAADKTVASGTYTLTITGTGNSVAETTTVKAVVSAPFTVVPTATVTVPQGGTATDTVKMTYATAFSSAVAMTATLPTGVSGLTATYSPTSVSATGNSTLTLAADSTVKTGSYTVTAIGTGSGVAISAPITVTVAAPYAVQSSAASVALIATGSGTANISLSGLNAGFVSDVVLTATGTSLPAGLTTSWDTTSAGTLTKGAGSATLTITADKTVASGTYTLTITGTGNSVAETTTVKAVVSAPFAVVPTATVTVPQGGSATDTVNVTYATGFSSTVALTATVPTGVNGLTATYSPTSLSATGSSTLTVAADSTVAKGTYKVNVIGTGSGVAISPSVTVTVVAPYTVQSSAASVSLIQTGTGTANISLGSVNAGFVSDVVLAISGTNLPAGLTTTWDTTSKGTLAQAAGTATLTIAADSTVATGTYTLTVTGTGNGVAVTTTVKAVVSAPFTVVPTATASVPQSGSGTDTVTVTYATGFSSTVAMTATLPTGVTGLTATYSPTSLSASGSSTLTVAADSTVAKGTYKIIVIGTGSGVAISSSFNVTITASSSSSTTPAVVPGAASVSVPQGGRSSTTVSITGLANGFNDSIQLIVTGTSIPNDLSNSWDSTSSGYLIAPYSGSGGATLTFDALSDVPTGTYTFTITPWDNGATTVAAAATITVHVTTQLFTVQPSTSTVNMPLQTAGGTQTLTVSVTNPQAGFAYPVTLAVSGGLPSGLTATWDNVTNGVLHSASDSATLTFTTVTDSVTPNYYNLYVTGTSNNVIEGNAVVVTVPAPQQGLF